LLGVVHAAIQGNVDCEDYISHLIVPAFISLTSAYLAVSLNYAFFRGPGAL
jgi:hypothetical protein